MNEAQPNASHFHRAWEGRQISEAMLLAINEEELNYARLHRAWE